jgi:hypothetical protein
MTGRNVVRSPFEAGMAREGGSMGKQVASLLMVALGVLMISLAAAGSVVNIGGTGAISTSDSPNGPLGLLDGGEVATAQLVYSINTSGGVTTLTLTVTNTSPAVLGTDATTTPDAPVISDIMFSVPTDVTGMTLNSVGGVTGSAGWDFSFDPNAEPSKGFGFLKNEFDAFLDGGPPGPAPVIASIFDPNINDGPGDPVASPVMFVFTLAFSGGLPAGFSADWFTDGNRLGDPEYLAAAKFMSGANGGSGTVTDGELPPPPPPNLVPSPASIMSLLSGLMLLGGFGLRKRS